MRVHRTSPSAFCPSPSRGGRAQRIRSSLAILLFILFASESGCTEDGPKTYPVKGKVTYKDGKPVTSGNILFESVSDTKIQAAGDLQADGSFELGSNLGKPGTVAGDHRVLIIPPLAEFGQKAAVSNKYASFETSGLKATIKEGGNTVELVIEK